MTSFNFEDPTSLSPSTTVGMQDVGGLMKIHFQTQLSQSLTQIQSQTRRALFGLSGRSLQSSLSALLSKITFPEITFTEIDRAFLVWGAIALVIFSLAQFSALAWTTQSFVDAALTGFGIIATAKLTWRLACSERLSWVVCLWAVLMAGGVIATAGGIFCGVSAILINLCPLWLGLCALGYLAMAIGLGSRSFSAASLVHALAIPFLAVHPSGQFLFSGLVMASTLFFFSFVAWDMKESEAEELCGVKPRD